MFSINSFLSKAAVAAALLFPVQAAAQCVIDKPAYMLYTDEGMPSSFGDMIEAMAQSDVIFFGEYHNSSVVHWLERVVFTSLADRLDNKLTLGMEMFEADTQLKVDEYMAGLISEERFLAETYLWDNYKTDYAPVVKCAKERDPTHSNQRSPSVCTGCVCRECGCAPKISTELSAIFWKSAGAS